MAAPNTSYDKRFAGKREEVARSIRNLGISGTMDFYGVKNRQHFINWLRNNLDGELNITPLSNLKAGEKGFWYRQHRDFILTLLEIFGRDFVLRSLGMGEDALDRLVDYSGRHTLHRGLTRLQRAELDTKEALRLARETRQLVDTFVERFGIIDEARRREAGIVREVRVAHAGFTEDVSACLGMRIQAFIKAGLDSRLERVRRLAPEGKLMISDIMPQKIEPQVDEGIKKAYLAHPFASAKNSIKES